MILFTVIYMRVFLALSFPLHTSVGKHLLTWLPVIPAPWCSCSCGIPIIEYGFNLGTCFSAMEYNKGDGMSLLWLCYKRLTFILLVFSLAFLASLFWLKGAFWQGTESCQPLLWVNLEVNPVAVESWSDYGSQVTLIRALEWDTLKQKNQLSQAWIPDPQKQWDNKYVVFKLLRFWGDLLCSIR